MKKCYTCEKYKELSEFNKNNSKEDGLNTICKICSRENSRRYYKDNSAIHKKNVAERNKVEYEKVKALIYEVKEYVGCYFCNEKEHVCLDFHHEDNTKKKFGISCGGRKGYKATVKEMKKCIIMCSNCHKKLHAGILKI